MTSAPVEITGRNSLRYTVSVVDVVLWPTSRAISSTGTPCSLMIETNVRRNSRGLQFSPIPASIQIFRKPRRTWDGSSGVPTAEANTNSCSRHRAPASSLSSACLALWAFNASTTATGRRSVRRDFLVFTSSWAPTDRHTATCGGTGGSVSGSPSRSTWSQRRARASSGRQRVSRQSTMYACNRDTFDALIRAWACGSVRLGWASFQPFRRVDERCDIPAHEVVRLRIADRPDQAIVGDLDRPGRPRGGEL